MDNSQFPFDEKKAKAADASAEAEGGSVTGMFAAVPGGSKAAASMEDLLAELLRPQGQPPASAAPPAAKDAAVPAKEAGPGEFTSIFKQIPIPRPVAAAPPAETPPAETPVWTPVLPPAAAQVQEWNTPPVQAPAQAAPWTSAPSAPANAPGEFTQFLQKMPGGEKPGPASGGPEPIQGAGAWAAALPGAPSLRGVHPIPPILQTPETPQAAEPLKTSDAPGSFTQLFRAVSAGGGAAKPVAPPPAEVAAPPQAPGAFTQMFQAIATKPAEQVPRAAPVEGPKPVPVSQGGFTHLLDSLSPGGHTSPSPASAFPGARETAYAPLQAAPAAQPFQGGPGEFTRLLHTLSDPPPTAASVPVAAVPAAPMYAAPAAQPPAQAGPGEYTRIISSSALREAGGGGAAFPPLAPAQGKPLAFPSALPPLPHLKPPAAPHPPAAPAGFGLPQAFAPPAAPPAAPAPQSKLQQYLPLILVINVALLLIVVMILFFALRHHN